MTPRTTAAALLAAGTLLLSSCGSGDTSDTTPDTTADTTSGSTKVTTTANESPGDASTLDRYAGYQSVSYADDERWLCRPDRDDICSGDLDSTTVAADGTLTVVPFEPATDPVVDCFYVYPTISRDPTPVSDWNATDEEEGYAAYNQVARLRSQCRVFAPVYRQRTLASIASRISGGEAAGATEATDPYADVLDAWKTYMANDNGGRGVVLVGHSQGSALLNQLIKEEIDPNADVRAQLVSAYLAGWAVAVPEGKDAGGDFASVPVCRSEAQAGCVITWASFRSTAPPPPDSFFGRPRAGADPAACTNPASLAGGAAQPRDQFPANRSASILASLAPDAADAAPWIDPAVGKVTTPFVSVPGLVSVECASANGFNYLEVTVQGDPADPRADDIGGDLTPQWGLHLVDINLVIDDMAALIGAQSRTWVSTR